METDDQNRGEHHPFRGQSSLSIHVTGSVIEADSTDWTVIRTPTAVFHATFGTVVVAFHEDL